MCALFFVWFHILPSFSHLHNFYFRDDYRDSSGEAMTKIQQALWVALPPDEAFSELPSANSSSSLTDPSTPPGGSIASSPTLSLHDSPSPPPTNSPPFSLPPHASCDDLSALSSGSSVPSGARRPSFPRVRSYNPPSMSPPTPPSLSPPSIPKSQSLNFNSPDFQPLRSSLPPPSFPPPPLSPSSSSSPSPAPATPPSHFKDPSLSFSFLQALAVARENENKSGQKKEKEPEKTDLVQNPLFLKTKKVVSELDKLLATSLFEKGSVKEIAERVTILMWKSYSLVKPTELFDGVWQVGNWVVECKLPIYLCFNSFIF